MVDELCLNKSQTVVQVGIILFCCAQPVLHVPVAGEGKNIKAEQLHLRPWMSAQKAPIRTTIAGGTQGFRGVLRPQALIQSPTS